MENEVYVNQLILVHIFHDMSKPKYIINFEYKSTLNKNILIITTMLLNYFFF